MKKKALALVATMLLSCGSQLVAQVNEINFTASPTAGYTVWNKATSFGQSPFWGVRAGFTVGQVLELTGTYQRSFDLKTKIENIKWTPASDLGKKMAGTNANIEYYGGEMRLNLLPSAFMTPFLKAGTGVMNLRYKDKAGNLSQKEAHLYGLLGAGLKFNFTRRIALSLEGEDLLFNVNKNELYIDPSYNGKSYLSNWGGRASLDIYLGGRQYANDKLSRAFKSMYSDGFRGLKFVLEPGLAYVDFNEKSLFRDQWLAGGAVGVDFNSYLGLRGFYYQATYSPTTPWKDFDKTKIFTKALMMYGGHLVARLNAPRGVTPYVTLGAGYLHVDKDNYYDANNMHNAESGLFAMAGAGLEIPLGRYVALFGNINAMCNAEKAADVKEPSQVRYNLMYKAGIRFNIGAKSKAGKALYDDYAAGLLESQKMASMHQINELRAAKNKELEAKAKELEAKSKELEDLKEAFEGKLAKLNKKLAKALKNKDMKAARRIAQERDQLKSSISKIDEGIETTENAKHVVEVETEKVEQQAPQIVVAPQVAPTPQVVPSSSNAPVIVTVPATTPSVENKSNLKVLSATQLENMIARILIQTGANQKVNNESVNGMTDLDKILLFSALSNGTMKLNADISTQLGLPAVSQGQACSATGGKLSTDAKLEAKIKALEENLEAKRKELRVKALEAKLKELNKEEESVVKAEANTVVKVEESAVVEEAPACEEATKEVKKNTAVSEPVIINAPKEEAPAVKEEVSVVEEKVAPAEEEVVVVVEEETAPAVTTVKEESSVGIINFEGVDLGIGAQFSKETAKTMFKDFNIKNFVGVASIRPNWEIWKTGLCIAPEAFYAYGDGFQGCGLIANAILRLKFIPVVTPYAGIGYGASTAFIKGVKYEFKKENFDFFTNLLAGIRFNGILGGALFVEYSTRVPNFKADSFFNNNLVSLGYSLKF